RRGRLPADRLPRLAPGLPLRRSPAVVHARHRVPLGLAGIDDLGGRDRDSRFDREPDALLPARGDHRPHDAAGEVLGHVPLSDLLAARDARRLACAVVAGPDGTLRARQDRPRRPAMTLDLISPAPRLAVDRTGDGPLVVFLHGIDGNRTNWRDQLGVFAAHFTAAALDARGYGASDDYAGPLAFDDFAGDLRRVLDHYGARRAHLVGLSMGGRIAMRFYFCTLSGWPRSRCATPIVDSHRSPPSSAPSTSDSAARRSTRERSHGTSRPLSCR